MEIAPNSIIRLFSGVPLDPSYRNTIYFGGVGEQLIYFGATQSPASPITVLSNLTQQYYTRVNRGIIRVKVPASNLYGCNYMCFQNTSYGTKWFYAFVTSVEWINNEVTELRFTIDVMQTYLFDATLRECFVEREHGAIDAIGFNIVPEPVGIGELVPNIPTGGQSFSYDQYTSLQDYCVVVGTIDETHTEWSDMFPWFDQIDGKIYDKIYGGLTLRAFIGANHVNAFLDSYKKVPNNIVCIYMCPVKLIASTTPSAMGTDEGYEIPNEYLHNVYEWNTHNGISELTSIDGYVPRNRKLLTAPYNYYILFNSSGEALNLRFEDFTAFTPQFKIEGNFTYPPSIEVYPINYKKSGSAGYRTEKLVEKDYPLCSWYSDYYQAWLAQIGLPTFERQSAQGLINFIHGGFDSAFGSAKSGNKENVRMALASNLNRSLEIEANAIANFATEREMANAHADVFKGSMAIGSLPIATSEKNFRGMRVSVKYEIAQRIDDFFDKYGYATNLVKVPNRHVRPYYTYTQTKGCTVVGNLPADDIVTMENIYDSGITFWDRYATVGDYSVNNRPNLVNP